LPSFDFSMPSFDGAASSASSAPSATDFAGAGGAPSDLPAHLQLPTFPQFDMPPVPGEATSAPGPDGGSTSALEGAPPGASTLPSPETATPPPRPPPPPPRRRPAKRPTTLETTLPPLALPTLGSAEPHKQEVTLLGSEAARELAEVRPQKRPVLPFVIIAVLVVAGIGAWVKRDAIVLALAAKDKRPQVVETAQDKALAFFAAGQDAYDHGKLDVAVKNFESALTAMPHFARAHRALAIAYAKQNRAADAVEHYRSYLDLSPNAPEAAQVRKIIDDYEKAKAAAAEANKAADDNGKRKKNPR